jgi:anti-sigma-K factor RskA
MRRRIHELAAAYALDALEPREQRRFERHMARCEPCAYEVRRLGQDAVRLGRAASFPPPPMMRERVLTAVLTTPQEAAPARSAASIPVTRAHLRARPRPRQPRLRLTAVAAAFCLGAAVVMGVQYVRVNTALDRERTAAAAVNQVLAAPDASARSGTDGQGRGITAVVSNSLHRAVVSAHGLPTAPSGRVYQLWLMGGSGSSASVRSVGLLPSNGGPVVATALNDRSTAFAITVEPDGGSARPTTDPVAQLPLALQETGSITSTALTHR